MTLKYIRATQIRKFAKANGRRVGRDFLEQVDAYVGAVLLRAAKTHNGGKITLDRFIAAYCGAGALPAPTTNDLSRQK